MEEKNNGEKDFGDVIKEIRKSMGKSLEDVHRDTGITSAYICRLEGKSRKNISVEKLKAIIPYYGFSESDIKKLLGMPEKEKNYDDIIEILRNRDYKFGNERTTVIKRLRISELFKKVEEYATKDRILREDDAEVLNKLDDIRQEYKRSK